MGGLSSSIELVCVHINVNNLSNKLNELNLFLNTNSVDFLGVSESWLTDDTPDSFINIPGYNIFRADCPENIRKHGVAVYIGSYLMIVPGEPLPPGIQSSIKFLESKLM